MQLLPDLGRQMVELGAKKGQEVVLMDLTFSIAQVYFNLNHISMGTISILTSKGFCGSLDFEKDLRYQVLHLLSKITIIKSDEFQKINDDEMVVFDLAKVGKTKNSISGLYLRGKLDKNEIALPTGEVFIPILLDKIELIESCLIS